MLLPRCFFTIALRGFLSLAPEFFAGFEDFPTFGGVFLEGLLATGFSFDYVSPGPDTGKGYTSITLKR